VTSTHTSSPSSAVAPPDVAGVWRRWEPRFIAAGVDYNIVVRLKQTISDWAQFSPEWSREGDELAGLAQDAFDEGRRLSAAGLWALASLLHHFGGMYFVSDMDQFHRSHARAVELYTKAAPHLSIPARRVVATLGDAVYPGYLQVPPSDGPPPVVMLFNGFEGTKEESQNRVAELHERGLATLSWDGPGRGEAWARSPMTGNYGPATAAMIDELEKVGTVDATRVGAIGPNRGGFVAAKAASVEPRIRAIATTSPGFDRREADWGSEYQGLFLTHIFKLTSREELAERMMQSDLTLEGDAPNITCPMLIVAGDRDHGAHFEGSKRLYQEVRGEKRWVVVKGSERNGNNVPYIIRPLMADFVAEHLGAGR
jgi:alpha-beta hydrolase superfamily lysophospholipase